MVLTATNQTKITQGIRIRGKMSDEYAQILSPEALHFLAMLQRRFGARRSHLLELRQTIQQQINAGWLPDFPEETENIRRSDWKIASIPPDLQDRRVEITGPVDRKMIINALNSGANAYMADFEDSSSPTWDNMVSGQLNLRDAVAETIEYRDDKKNKVYRLNEKTAVLIVRPRGWHLLEEHLLIDEQPISASLFDFGLYFFHNVEKLREKGTAPYFYLPKLENRHEATLWNDVFIAAQEALGIPTGTIKVTVLLETILASFEVDEILHALKDHIVALNCGRWDYIFSFIKKFSHRQDFVLPERSQVTMTRHFMRSYSLLTIATCHRRGALAMGGMAAQIPIKSDPEANQLALAKVRSDKEREVNDGHDGTWVAHPALVPLAKEVFDSKMKGLNQLSVLRNDVQVTAADLLTVPEGTITEAGIRNNIRVGILYISAWLEGIGCVPLYNLMEDAATAEICRAQLWQWLHHHAKLEDRRNFDLCLFQSLLDEETATLRQENQTTLAIFDKAVELFQQLVTAEEFEEFLTLKAYPQILEFDE
ncbi:malate synthase A [Gloeothece citriformis PCC 7424]|uniref:Malate synthase n=1 Tax=Gloeothece citriformis (strain PCC 7424) TaxID=65393 RepID=B7KL57_GLOC7|nr:malate synthase A [Gloeothece citriformis]ACK72429.1 malate synthase A [Gloeothece citriformis PCC 7424]